MKLSLLLFLVCVACSTEAKVPGVCQRNLRDCTEAYDDSSGPNHRSRAEWNVLCKQDLKVCKEN